tara:strand:- start:627 stop:809 length:183 start_codon:yes stop_codon:yes gene_type:complete
MLITYYLLLVPSFFAASVTLDQIQSLYFKMFLEKKGQQLSTLRQHSWLESGVTENRKSSF